MEFLDSDKSTSLVDNKEKPFDTEYEWFKEEFYKLTTIQLNYYKEKQMKRRINTLIEKKGLDGYESFVSLLQTNEKELSAFVDYITINVTEFFRTPEHWQYIEKEVFTKYTPEADDKIRIWCAASSSGEEPYSMAMCLADYFPLSNIEIIATDIDENILAKAKRGQFDERSIDTLPEKYRERYLERYFTRQGQVWKISDEIKSCIEFRQMDLLRDEYPENCDMIVCRNVLIYFTEEAKEIIYARFKSSLKSERYLFTGDTEQIVYHKLYGFKKEKNFLYISADQLNSNNIGVNTWYFPGNTAIKSNARGVQAGINSEGQLDRTRFLGGGY